MPATIASLLADPELGLRLVVGEEDALREPVEWATTTEVADPSPFLTGGQLVLTTGMRLSTPRAQRQFIRALVAADSRGVGFGCGFEHESIPEALLDEARQSGLPVLDVAYAVPFSRITRAISEAAASEQVAELATLHRLHQELVTSMTSDGLAGVVDELARITGARVAVSRYGEILAGRLEAEGGDAGAPAQLDDEGIEAWDAFPITVGRGMLSTLHISRPRAHEGLLSYARALIALQLSEQLRRGLAERERAGEVFGDLVRGRLSDSEAEIRLGALGVSGGRHRVLVVAGDGRRPRELAGMPLPISLAGAASAVVDGELVVLLPGRLDARAAAEAIVGLGRAAGVDARVGIGDAYPLSEAVRWSYFEARDALSRLDPDAPIAEASRLSISSLLLASEDVPVRELAAEVLGPLEDADREQGSSLVATLDAYLSESGAVGTVAARLGTHRNTVRYRLDQIAQLTGLDPRVTSEAVQLYLALQARTLLGRDGRPGRGRTA